MDTKKIIKRSIVVLVYLSIIVLAVLAVSNHIQLKKLASNVNSINTANNISADPPVSAKDNAAQISTVQGTNAPAAREDRSSTDNLEDLESKLEAPEKVLDKSYEQRYEEQVRKAEAAKKLAEADKKALDDPAKMKTITGRTG